MQRENEQLQNAEMSAMRAHMGDSTATDDEEEPTPGNLAQHITPYTPANAKKLTIDKADMMAQMAALSASHQSHQSLQLSPRHIQTQSMAEESDEPRSPLHMSSPAPNV